MTMAPGMEVASSSNPTTSDPLSPHSNARSPVNSSSTAAWYPPPPSASSAITDPRYSSTSHVDNMMMPGASSLHRGASSPPVGSGGVDSESTIESFSVNKIGGPLPLLYVCFLFQINWTLVC